MNSVAAAQREPFGELPGVVCELCVHGDPQELSLDRLELRERALVGGRGEASSAACRAKCRAALGVGEDARRGGVRARPQFVGNARVFLGDD
jgi:hypothetical protein